jgi:hypothetical protein
MARALSVGRALAARLAGERTGVPPAVVLIAKLVAIALLLSRTVTDLPEPFLAFVPPLDAIPAPGLFRRALQLSFAASTVWLFVGRRPRAAALSLGATLITALLSSRVYYMSSRWYAAYVLVLCGLWEPRADLWPLRFQVCLMYAASGLDKLLTPLWRSGEFAELWLPDVAPRVLPAVERWLPVAAVSQALCWIVIASELALAVGFALPRLRRVAAAYGALFHIGLFLLTGETFHAFFVSVLASYLAFVPWPPEPPPVVHGWLELRARLLASPTFWLAAAVVVMSPVGPRRVRAVIALGLWLMVVVDRPPLTLVRTEA